MVTRSTLLHLRIPFSIFLLPVFLFAFSISNNPGPWNVLLVFVIVHFLLYPASNGYNSYFDKDEESIGGLKRPPKVTKDLYYVSLILDVIAIGSGLILSIPFALMLFFYGLVSKAYSHPGIRIKKFPVASWLIAGIFQGFFTFLMCYIGLNDTSFSDLLFHQIWIPALLSTSILLASYPMTQIYQHREDQKRGDITLSILLGIKRTFYFTAGAFALAIIAFVGYLRSFFEPQLGWIFLAFTVPIVIYFGWWFLRSKDNPKLVDYDHTMRLNMISSICLSTFFIWMSFY